MLKILKFSKILDYTVSLACLIYGLFELNWIWILGGAVGLVMAYYSPATYVVQRLENKKKRAMEEAAYASAVTQSVTGSQPEPAAPQKSTEDKPTAPAPQGAGSTGYTSVQFKVNFKADSAK